MDRDELPGLYKIIRLLYLYNNRERNPLQIANALNRMIKEADVVVSEADVLAALAYGTICEDWFEFDIQIKYHTPKSHKNARANSTLLKDLCYQLVLHPSRVNQTK
jgi:hypothetical protein